MDRRDFYFRQKVTEAELDGAFDAVETADWAQASDAVLTGILLGLTAAQNGVPNTTINVAGPGVAYDATGRRISVPTTQNVDVSVDESSVSTAVAGGGNEKYVSVFLEFDRTLTDPRIDGNSLGLFFDHAESFRFVVRQGAEAAAGLATPVPLDSGLVLVCDILRTFGVTQILNAAILTTRRQDWARLEGGTLELICGTPRAAVESLLQYLNDHVDGVSTRHPATDIDYAGSPVWAGAISGLPVGTVENALDQVVTQLGSIANPCGGERVGTRATVGTYATGSGYAAANVWSVLNSIVTDLGTTGATSGAHRVGSAARTAWLGGRTNPAASVFAALDKIITDLAATTSGDDGAERIGFFASGNIAATDVGAAIRELDTEKGGLALANTWTNTNLFNALLTAAAGITVSAGGLTVGAGVADIQERITLGSDLIATAANNLLARIQSTLGDTAVIATTGRTLLWEILNANSGTRAPIRIYATQRNGGGLSIAINCVWDNATALWTKTLAGQVAMLYEFGQAGIDFFQRNSASAGTWNDSGWNENQLHVDLNLVVPSISQNEGVLQFTPVAGTGTSNPGQATATVANALYSINIVDAWIKGLNNTGKDDAFGCTAANVANGSGSTITFDRSAGGTFQQALVVSGNTGTSATTVGFMTAVPASVNTCVVRRWRWDGAAVSETTLGDWSLIRMARVTS